MRRAWLPPPLRRVGRDAGQLHPARDLLLAAERAVHHERRGADDLAVGDLDRARTFGHDVIDLAVGLVVPGELAARAGDALPGLGAQLDDAIAELAVAEPGLMAVRGEREHERGPDDDAEQVALDLTVLQPARDPPEHRYRERRSVDGDRVDHEAIDDLERAA